MKRATSVARDQLVSLGVCVGKFTHSDKFRLTIGALELLAAHAKHKVRPPREKLRAASFALFANEACFFGGGVGSVSFVPRRVFPSPPRRVRFVAR